MPDKLAELGLASIVFDPCGNTPGKGDYLAIQRKNLAALANIYPLVTDPTAIIKAPRQALCDWKLHSWQKSFIGRP